MVLKKKILNYVNVFSLLQNYLPLEKDGALHLNNLESPSSKDALCLVLLKLAKWFLRRRFLNFVDVFSLFRSFLPSECIFTILQLSPLWEGRDTSFEKKKLESSSPKDALCQVWLKMAQWFLRRRFFKVYYFPIISPLEGEEYSKKMKKWKVYRRTDRQTNDGRQIIRKAHLTFQLRWAKTYLQNTKMCFHSVLNICFDGCSFYFIFV